METPLLGLPPAPLPSALRKPMRDGPPPVPTSLARGSSAPHPAAPAGSGGLAARQMLARGVSAAPGGREQQRKRVRIISGVAEGLASGSPLRQRTRTLIQRQHSAAAHVEDAFSGVMDDEFKRPWLQLIWAKSLVFVRLAMGVYIGLGFFERPSWCYSPTIRNCTDPSGEAVPLSGLPLLPPAASGAIELLCLATFAAEMLLKRLFRGPGSFWSNRWSVFRLIVMPFAVVDVIADLSRDEGLIPGPVRLCATPPPHPTILDPKPMLLRTGRPSFALSSSQRTPKRSARRCCQQSESSGMSRSCCASSPASCSGSAW